VRADLKKVVVVATLKPTKPDGRRALGFLTLLALSFSVCSIIKEVI